MSILNQAKEEFNRSPIATISSGVGVLIAGTSLFIAWFSFHSESSATYPSVNNFISEGGMNVRNLLLIVAYFLAITFLTARIIRFVARKHSLAAFFTSVIAISLTNFSTVLMIYLAPPRAFSQSTFTSAHDLIFYGSGIIVLIFCGKAVLIDLLRNDDKDKEPNIMGGLFMALILLFTWGGFVWSGQTKLTNTLLPEITHPIPINQSSSGKSGSEINKSSSQNE
ncbi:hypothetical protein [Jiulongibacter sediminis]|uniref:Uncharacterized protein n=1 Tax=Jiulongibacter sediminis TaxID=1605367 RepID=A0A0N8H9F7_9BACT|nr:hypothetical protein [Jiulongibacter sediminis]KPM47244.1 hypothetical protein AFM12_15715 [Jiulongibacter sediminis]TBX22802.1 hypothetical protein TK44_15725 [Jiulongibacter sediminis]